MKKLPFCILFVLVTFPAFSQLKAIVELNRHSTLSIYVETNMMNFSLVQKGDQLLNTPVTLSACVQKNKLVVEQNKLDIDVRGFKSENLIAQREFYKLMKVEQFPRMKIELLRFVPGTETNADHLCGTAVLNITITNVTKKYEFPVVIGKDDGLMRVAGKKRISITDFGLAAPKNLLLGMVKINEQIVIDLNFLCKLRLNEGDVAEQRVFLRP